MEPPLTAMLRPGTGRPLTTERLSKQLTTLSFISVSDGNADGLFVSLQMGVCMVTIMTIGSLINQANAGTKLFKLKANDLVMSCLFATC